MNDSMGGIAEGATTNRVRVDPATQAVRAVQQANARGKLAAIVLARHGIDPSTTSLEQLPDAVKAELREVAQALGLDGAPARRPGYCACGAVLTVTATSHQPGRLVHGHCSDCSRKVAPE